MTDLTKSSTCGVSRRGWPICSMRSSTPSAVSKPSCAASRTTSSYGAERVGRDDLSARVEQLIRRAQTVLPFDTSAARTYGALKATLESSATPLAEPYLRIASIALTRGLILVTRNVRHFQRVPELTVENWIDET